ncbi:MAG: esterase [Lachnospiraceae bacterium]|nr:esterase [Lachnospiraceae bacterium]
MRSEQNIGGKRCYIYENDQADNFLIQAIDEHDLELLDREIEIIKELSSNKTFSLAAFLIEDWNEELSPWEAPAVFGNNGFGAGAADTLSFITDTLIPYINNVYMNNSNNSKTYFYLGGYSLSGLFALWAAYQTDIFRGIAAVSPSVWFPDWDNYMTSHSIQTLKVYLSLGNKEEKTKNKVMSKVGDNIRKQYEVLCEESNEKTCILEWNPGNHFVDSEIRMAKGFAWLLNH